MLFTTLVRSRYTSFHQCGLNYNYYRYNYCLMDLYLKTPLCVYCGRYYYNVIDVTTAIDL